MVSFVKLEVLRGDEKQEISVSGCRIDKNDGKVRKAEAIQ